MGFAIGMEEERLQEKAVKGRYMKVAVGCWFTATGKAIPKIVKYEDEDGMRRLIGEIETLKTEQKYYAGILSRKYVCRAVVDGRKQEFILLYHPQENIWDMVLP